MRDSPKDPLGGLARLPGRHLANTAERYAPRRGATPAARLVLHDVAHGPRRADPYREANCVGVEDIEVGVGRLQPIDQTLCNASSHGGALPGALREIQ